MDLYAIVALLRTVYSAGRVVIMSASDINVIWSGQAICAVKCNAR